MPFALNQKRYTMRLQPNGGAGSTVTMQWACYDREFDDELDTLSAPDDAVGRDFHALFKFAVGPMTKDTRGERRNARISAYLCPTPEDDDDAKYIGMCIDENNEGLLHKGVPTTFHIKAIRAPRDDHSRSCIFPGMTFFVEWSALDDREVCFLPVVSAPLAYMQILERTTELVCTHRLATVMKDHADNEVAPIPLPPKERTKPPAKRPRGQALNGADPPGSPPVLALRARPRAPSS